MPFREMKEGETFKVSGIKSVIGNICVAGIEPAGKPDMLILDVEFAGGNLTLLLPLVQTGRDLLTVLRKTEKLHPDIFKETPDGEEKEGSKRTPKEAGPPSQN